MTKKRYLKVLALAAILSITAAACGGGGGSSNKTNPPATSGAPSLAGGTYRTAIEDFGFTGAFDPTGEYLGNAWGLYSDLLLRTLVTYKHVLGLAGDEIVPDLATDTGQVSSDGLTYTFHLKDGIKFAPPVNREITSADVLYAFQRIDSKALVAQYGSYYDGTVEGMDAPVAKPAEGVTISGIKTPDDKTIVFTLQQPTGDFIYRLAMPATAPVPPEVGKCFTKAGDYGRDVVSSGPYMIRGADKIDISSCGAIKPMSGFDPTKRLIVVRNPNYNDGKPGADPSDDPAVRENNVDGISITINTNTNDIFDKVSAGELDGTWASIPPTEILQNYLTDPNLKDKLHADPGDRTWYITMNTLVPPFDDIHVRKAVNYALDKAAMLQAVGGPTFGEIATHIMPPSVLDFGGETYDPYQSPNEAGDIKAAQNEMSQSKYDKNHDGKCDDPVCQNLLFVNRNYDPWTKYTPIIQNNLSALGITVKPRELDTGTAYTTIQTVKNLVPIAANAGWGKDYADPFTFADLLFGSGGILCTGQVNYSEAGMTQDQAKECGVESQWNATHPDQWSTDADIDHCEGLADQERTDCWVQYDKKMMEEVVPWVPYRWATNITVVGDSVTKYEFDQFAGAISWCHIAVDNNVDPNTI
ncbi:MAG: ABC transporter substrate-binding protein [Actinomycetota bacterium]